MNELSPFFAGDLVLGAQSACLVISAIRGRCDFSPFTPVSATWHPCFKVKFSVGRRTEITGRRIDNAVGNFQRIEQFTFDLEWQDGDVALVDNYMTMHGRKPFSGDRKRQVLVALAMD